MFDPSVLDQLARCSNLQRSYNFELRLPDIAGISGDEISKYCQEIEFGDYSIGDVATMRYGGFTASYAGIATIEDVTFKFIRVNPDIVGAYFKLWRLLYLSDDGYYYPKANYAKNIYVDFLDTDGTVSGTFLLANAWPHKMPRISMSYKQNTLTELTFGLRIDALIDDSDPVNATQAHDVTSGVTTNPATPAIALGSVNSAVPALQAQQQPIAVPGSLKNPSGDVVFPPIEQPTFAVAAPTQASDYIQLGEVSQQVQFEVAQPEVTPQLNYQPLDLQNYEMPNFTVAAPLLG